MKQPSERMTLGDVLNAYVDSTSDPSPALLAKWIHLYPQYEQELREFTVSWSLMETLPPPSKHENIDEDTLVLRGMSIVQNILQESKHAPQSHDKETTIEGILKEGTAHGLSIQQIAERSQLSTALVRKLDRRLIRSTSIPHQAIEYLARAIQCECSVVVHYLQGNPTLLQGASYRAEQAPSVERQEDFFDAVRKDLALSEERRNHWLAHASPNP